MSLTCRPLADAINEQAQRAILLVGEVMRDDSDGQPWPIPAQYTLRTAVSWTNPNQRGLIMVRATIDACTVQVQARIDRGAQELRTAYIELAKSVWTEYLLKEQPSFCALLALKGKQ